MAEIRTIKKEVPTSQKLRGASKKVPEKAKAEKVVNNGSFAVIENGGKQYRVAVGDSIKIEKVNNNLKVGDSLIFDKILFVNQMKNNSESSSKSISS